MSSGVPTRIVSGGLQRQIFKMPKSGLTEQQISTPIISALEQAGFDVLLSCQGLQCGGFDFHTAAPLAQPPAIFVDLRSFVAMTFRNAQGDFVFAVVSRFASDIYIQIDHMTARQLDISGASKQIALRLQNTLDRSSDPADYPKTLEQGGAIILSDLTFDSGSAKLGEQDYASLTALADYLQTHQDSKIILIGHSDAVGSLQGNITLSQKRAASVRTRLIGDHGINPDRILAQGVGYLAPIAPNTTDENRDKNRRVEAILDQD
jgi:OOP family OmpA-OmpF porin